MDHLLPKNSESPSIIAAGLCLLAADTGRVLMLQRSINETDPAAGKWEFPGGHIEADETPLQAAKREFSEEIGARPPTNMQVLGSWRGGVYVGYVAVIKSEKDVKINKAPGRRYLNPDDPDGDNIETAAWWTRKDIRNNRTVRAELLKSYDDFKWTAMFALRKYERGELSKVANMSLIEQIDQIEQGLREKVIAKTAAFDASKLKDSASRLWTDIKNSPNLHKVGLGGDALRNIGLGATVGGATGLGKSLLTGDDHEGRNALIGALIGGAGGYGIGAATKGINHDSQAAQEAIPSGVAALPGSVRALGYGGAGAGGYVLGSSAGHISGMLRTAKDIAAHEAKYPGWSQYTGAAHDGASQLLDTHKTRLRGRVFGGGALGIGAGLGGQYMLERLIDYMSGGGKAAGLPIPARVGGAMTKYVPGIKDKLLHALGVAGNVLKNPAAQQIGAGGIGLATSIAAAPHSDSAAGMLGNAALGVGGGALLGRGVGNVGKAKIKSFLDRIAAYVGKKAVTGGTIGGAVTGVATGALPAMSAYAGSKKEANALILSAAKPILAAGSAASKGGKSAVAGGIEALKKLVTNPTAQNSAAGMGMLGWGMNDHSNQGLVGQGFGVANGVIGGGMLGESIGRGITLGTGAMKGKGPLVSKLLSYLSKNGRGLGAAAGALTGAGVSASAQTPKKASILEKVKAAVSDPTLRPLLMGAGGALAGAAATTAGEAMSHKQNKDYLTAALTGGVAGGGVGAGFGYLTRNGMSGLLPSSGSARDLGGIAEKAKTDPALLAKLKDKADQHPSVIRQTVGRLHKEQNEAIPLADELVSGAAGAVVGSRAGGMASNFIGTKYDANYIDLMNARQKGTISGVEFEKQLAAIQDRVKNHGPHMVGTVGKASGDKLIREPAALAAAAKDKTAPLTKRLLAALKLGGHHAGKTLSSAKTARPVAGGVGALLASQIIPRLIPSGE